MKFIKILMKANGFIFAICLTFIGCSPFDYTPYENPASDDRIEHETGGELNHSGQLISSANIDSLEINSITDPTRITDRGPLFVKRNLKAIYFVPSAWRSALASYHGVELKLNDNIDYEIVAPYIELAIKDIKSFGFNSIVLQYSFFINRKRSTHLKFLNFFLGYALKHGIGVIITLPYSTNDTRGLFNSCKIKPFTSNFILQVLRLENSGSLFGFNCGFESWGKVSPTSSELSNISQLRTYIENKNLLFTHVPATKRYPPPPGIDLFTIVTPQISPAGYQNQDELDQVFIENSQGSNKHRKGIEMSLWHNALGSTQGFSYFYSGVRKWLRMQYISFLSYRPRQFTSFTYQRLMTPQRPSGNNFFKQRGVSKSLIYRLRNAKNVLYDPIDSKFSTEVIGGSIQGNLSYLNNGINSLYRPTNLKQLDGKTVQIMNLGHGIKYNLEVNSESIQRQLSLTMTTMVWLKFRKMIDGQRKFLFNINCQTRISCISVDSYSDKIRVTMAAKNGQIYRIIYSLPESKMNSWNHISVRFKGSTENSSGFINLIVNGKIKETFNFKLATFTPSQIVLGNQNLGRPYPARGEFDDLFVFADLVSLSSISKVVSRGPR